MYVCVRLNERYDRVALTFDIERNPFANLRWDSVPGSAHINASHESIDAFHRQFVALDVS